MVNMIDAPLSLIAKTLDRTLDFTWTSTSEAYLDGIKDCVQDTCTVCNYIDDEINLESACPNKV